ncbi:Ig-like domain-containing protein [Shewanella cyperi]|uniref:Ig-like domain-containing protein n=1 Tax=Shewanella cyperi TaxID=2814292 RepID=UPI001A93E0E8|nr:Ig-like domain-containing protein [Shewanella cyperi]QSX41005.1 tandem-95 repeat protein [Shewanella cyperi]
MKNALTGVRARALLSLSIYLGLGWSSAQAADVVLSNGGTLGGTSVMGFNMGQSFTATKTGRITQVEIAASNNVFGTATLNIYSGAGNGGTLLYSKSGIDFSGVAAIIDPNVYSYTAITVDTEVPIISGNVYTFLLTPKTALDIGYVNSNNYAGGALFSPDLGGFQNGNDLPFKITQADPLYDSDGNLTAGAGAEASTIDTTVDTVGEAIDFMDFTLTDGGSGDARNLTASQIVVHIGGTSSNTERSAVTWRLNGPDATNVVGVYNSGAQTITFSGLSISVADGGNETYTINGYFNTTTGLTEGHTFTLSLDGATDVTVGQVDSHFGVTSSVSNGAGAAISVVASKLTFNTQPAGSVSGAALTTQPVVAATDAFGNTDVDYTSNITLTEGSAGSLSGTTTLAATAGVATFTNVVYTATADQEAFTLTAASGALTDGTSNAVNSDVVATQLIFTTQPAPTTLVSGASTNFSTVPVVKAVDGTSTVDTGYATAIVLSVTDPNDGIVDGTVDAFTGTGDEDILGSTVTISPTSGASTYTGLAIQYTAGGVSDTIALRATSGGLTAVNSSSINAISPPTVTDGNISISGGTGTAGAFRIGDVVTATWDNSGTGDNNAGVSAVTVDFSQFGGGAAVAASNNLDIWTATYTIVAGAIDASNRNVSVTATGSGSSTTADTTNATVDNIAPTVTDGNITVTGGTGTGGAFILGDTVTATWNNTAGGDNNSDTIVGVTVDFSSMGGGSAVTATDSAGVWSATYDITSGSTSGSNLNVSVEATDNAGNTTQQADTSNSSIDKDVPTVTSVSVPVNGTYIVGDSLDFTVNLDDNVTVDTGGGTPQLSLTIGATTRQAAYLSGSGTSALVFRHTVLSGDEDTDGIAVGALSANGGTLRDSSGNDLDLTLNSVGSTTSVLIDAIAPTVSIGSSASGTVNGQFDVTFTLSESSSDFTAADVTVGNGSKGSFSGSGTSYTLAVTPSGDGAVTVDVAGGVFTDAAGNGNTAATQFSINADVSAPTLSSSSPFDDEVNVATTVTPVLTFNETVQLGNGSISLQEVGGSSFESFDAGTGMGDNGGSVAVLGSALTITPGAALRTGKQYAIHIDNGAITDSNGNAYAGISDDTTLNFLVRPKLVLSVDKTEVSEPHSETATVTLSLQDDGGNAFVALSDVDVVLALSGTATLNSDYGLLGSNFTEGTLTLTVPAGSDSSTLSVTAIDDVVSDDGETIAVDIDSVSSGNATEVTAQSVSITVNENRTPTLTGLPASFTIVEDEVSNIDLSAVVLADADNDLLNLVLSVDSGTLTSPLGNSGNVTVVGSGTDAMVLTGLAADLNTFLDNANAVAITTAQDQTVDIVLSAAPSDGLANGSMSQATVSVTPVNDAPTGSVTISGMAVEDAMLTASNTLADVEGLGTISYQWNRNSVPVLGATAASYVLGDVDVGGLMTVTASYTDGQGTAESVTSAATAAVANVNDAPTGTVSISGVALEGETLTASHNLADDDGLGAVSFQWLRENAVIANASGSSYLLVAADIGSRISVRAGYTDGHGTAEAVDSAQTEAVVAANKAPVANNSQVSVDEDSSIAIELDATDPDQDTLAVTIETQPTNGELVQQGALWLYTPNADFNGDDSFSYSVSDGSLSSGTATVSITVTPVNDAPVAVADAFELSSDSGQFSAFNVLANDTDIDGDALTLYQVSTNLGEAKVVDNQLSYRAPLGYQGTVVVNYKVRDAAKAESSAVATLTVSSTAAGIVLTPPADVTVNATGLFTKVEMGTAVATAGGESLPVTVDSNGFFSPGAHKVTWSAADGDTTVSMTQAVNVIPLVGLSKDQTASEGSDVSFRVLLNGDAVSYPVEVPYSVGGTAATDGSDHDLVDGSVMFNQGELEKTVSLHLVDDGTPEGNETVVVTLGTPTHAVLGPKASHTLTIVESNVAPSVVLGATQGDGQTRIVSQDGGLVTVTATVTDPNTGDSHSFDWSQSDNALVDSDGDDSTFTFDPSTLSPGFYKLRVAVSDGDKTGMDRLKLRVEAALPTLDTTDSDGDGINDNDEGAGDKDGDGIPDYLDAVNLARNVVQETPASSNSFLMETEPGLALSLGDVAFRANGSDTGVSNGDVVTHGNEGAGATDDIDYRYGNGMFDFNVEELPLSGQSVNIVVAQFQPVPANAVYRKLMPGGWQDFVIDANNAVASASGAEGYCPPPGDAAYSTGLTEGHWCVQLTIEDGGPNDADGEVNSAIDDPGGLAVPAGSNNAPMTTADVVTMKRNASIDIDVLANDTDVDGDSLMLTSVNADLGQVSIVDNQLHYVAEAGHLGEAHLSYGVSDGKGGSASGKVTVSVLPNKAPVAAPDMASVHSGNSVVIDVLANDSDPDADALTVTAASAMHGIVVINADNSLTYTPTVGYDGTDTVSYSISDGDGGEAQGTVTIAVSAMETVTITNRSSGGALNFWALGVLLAGLWRRQSKNNKQGVKTK